MKKCKCKKLGGYSEEDLMDEVLDRYKTAVFIWESKDNIVHARSTDDSLAVSGIIEQIRVVKESMIRIDTERRTVKENGLDIIKAEVINNILFRLERLDKRLKSIIGLDVYKGSIEIKKRKRKKK